MRLWKLLTRSHIHLTHSHTPSLTHAITHSLAQSHTYPHSLTQSLTYVPTYPPSRTQARVAQGAREPPHPHPHPHLSPLTSHLSPLTSHPHPHPHPGSGPSGARNARASGRCLRSQCLQLRWRRSALRLAKDAYSLTTDLPTCSLLPLTHLLTCSPTQVPTYSQVLTGSVQLEEVTLMLEPSPWPWPQSSHSPYHPLAG